jgi:hypothetical protein
MLNPSTADQERDDPTIRDICRRSKKWGFRTIEVVNLFPIRATNPRECWLWAHWEHNGPDWYARDAIHHNLEQAVIPVVKRADFVVAAWGSAPWAQDWADHVIMRIQEETEKHLHCLGLTAGGAPKHPLARGRHRVPDGRAFPYAENRPAGEVLFV